MYGNTSRVYGFSRNGCTKTASAIIGPFRPAIELLKTIPGVGQSAAEVFVAETGGDMSRFPTAQHLAAWAGLAPANAGPAGKHRRAGSRKGANWLRRAFIEAAKPASRRRAWTKVR